MALHLLFSAYMLSLYCTLFPIYSGSDQAEPIREGLRWRRQLLALFLTSTNTFTALLVEEGTSIPAFQTFFNYALLNLVYTTFTVYKYGFKKWASVVVRDGWKCKAPFVHR